MTNTTPAYIFTVRSDHTVVLPNDVQLEQKWLWFWLDQMMKK